VPGPKLLLRTDVREWFGPATRALFTNYRDRAVLGIALMVGLLSPVAARADDTISGHFGFVLPLITRSGGDTASHVCRALRAQAIELHDEVEAGIARGTLRGGVFDGIAVVTKSGAFGDSGALIAVTDFFTCPKA